MSLKSRFHLPEGHYFLSHSVGAMPKGCEAAASEFLGAWKHQGGDAWPVWLEGVELFLQQLAALTRVPASGFCPQLNLSSALSKLVGALPNAKPGQRILATELDFPSMGFVLQQAEKKGYRLQLLEPQAGLVSLSQWQQALGEDVALAFITHAISETGQLQSVSEICALARSLGVMTVVDIAQSLGIIPIDLGQWQADAVLGSCVKWCCAGPGAAFLWLSDKLAQTLEPVDLGWFSHEAPFEFDIHDFRYAKGAKRFWGGTPSVLPYMLAAASLQQLRAFGDGQIYQHNQRLGQGILDCALSHELKVVTPNISGERSGTVVVDFADRQAAQQVFNRLGIKTDLRPRFGFRFSPHIYTDGEDMEVLLQGLRQLAGKRP
ncbi:aminotransferase class V-fold PLP-dependent enzyme [Shewanella algae]|uniref:aminotransferase class V-fold PLP-dependent enzyme n=1 Tax=Shewanella algae TaxID=38313 RepID=UPI003006563C